MRVRWAPHRGDWRLGPASRPRAGRDRRRLVQGDRDPVAAASRLTVQACQSSVEGQTTRGGKRRRPYTNGVRRRYRRYVSLQGTNCQRAPSRRKSATSPRARPAARGRPGRRRPHLGRRREGYIDFAGGLGATTRVTGLPAAVAAIHEQVDRYLHQCFHRRHVRAVRRRVPPPSELSPCRGADQKTLLVNSGAEALENAVKIARAYTGRPAVVVFEHAFHGRTLLTMTMTSKLVYKKGMGPFAPRSTGRRALSVPRRRHRGGDPRPRNALQERRRSSRSPASCSSRYRARAGSSRCRRTIRLGYGRCATGTGSSTSTTRCSRASAAPAGLRDRALQVEPT